MNVLDKQQVAAAEAKARAELKKALQEQKEQMEGERDRALEEARLVNDIITCMSLSLAIKSLDKHFVG